MRRVITLQHHYLPKLGRQRAVHHSPKHWILLHYHIQGVIFSKITQMEGSSLLLAKHFQIKTTALLAHRQYWTIIK
jgi:hypothetical protein